MRGDRLAQLIDLTRSITALRSLDDVLATTFRGLRPLLAFGGGSIQLLDDDGWIRLAATEPAAPPHVLETRIPVASSVGGRIILTERPLYVPDVPADSNVPASRAQGASVSRGVRSYFGVPLVVDGSAIGLIQIDSPEPDAWGDDDRLLLTTVAPVVAAAIQAARAHSMHGRASAALVDQEARQDQVRSLLRDEIGPTVATLVALTRESPAGADGDVEREADLEAIVRHCGAEARRLAAAVGRLVSMVTPVDVAEREAAADRPEIINIAEQPTARANGA